jgi:hypothetical protein
MGRSERRACSIVGADRKMVRYRSCRPPETELRGRLRELANERRHFGYRRLFIRIYRLYREEGTDSASAGHGNEPSERGPRSRSRQNQCALVAGLRA